jgi:uncharacterized membrane protein YcaP (DUF421 family)
VISLGLRKKLEMWSWIASLVIMIIVFLLFIFVYVTTARIEGKSEIHTSIIKRERFGIITQEDIYIDNMEKGKKYTSHGRLIEKQ